MKFKAYTHDGQERNVELCDEGFRTIMKATRAHGLSPARSDATRHQVVLRTSVSKDGIWHAPYLLASELNRDVLRHLGYSGISGVAVKYLLTGRTYLHQQLPLADEFDLRLVKLPKYEDLKVTIGAAKLARAAQFPDLCVRLGIPLPPPPKPSIEAVYDGVKPLSLDARVAAALSKTNDQELELNREFQELQERQRRLQERRQKLSALGDALSELEKAED